MPAATAAPLNTAMGPLLDLAVPRKAETIEAHQTDQAAPTTTPWPTPTPLPESWKTYANPDLQITFRYPDTWQAESATRLSGQSGFVELTQLRTAAGESTVCTLEANRHKPDRYGSGPQIMQWGTDRIAQACLIFPSADQPAAMHRQATALIWYPPSLKADTVLAVHASSDYLASFLQSFEFPGVGAPTPSSGIYNSPACGLPPDQPGAVASLPGGLTIHEYAIANAACDPFDQFDGFRAHIPQAALKLQAQWPDRFRQSLAAANQSLAPFGYRLVEGDAANGVQFDVYRGGVALLTSLTRFWPVSVNRSGTDFALVVQDSFNSLPPVLVRRALTATWQADSVFTYFPVPPVFVSDDLTWVELEPNDPWPPSVLNIRRGAQIVSTLTTMPPSPGGGPVRSLWSWEGHWILDLDGVGVMDGEILNDRLGYDEIFQWQLLGGKPFYFFRQGQHIGLSYDGHVLPYRYDDVIHGFLCCDPAVYNIDTSGTGVRFYARRNGVWYYVAIARGG